MLTRTARKASNGCVVILRPSREEELLSDHVFTIFDRTLTITGYEQLVTGAIVLIALGAWAVHRQSAGRPSDCRCEPKDRGVARESAFHLRARETAGIAEFRTGSLERRLIGRGVSSSKEPPAER